MKLPAFLSIALVLATAGCVEKRSKKKELVDALAARSADPAQPKLPRRSEYEPIPVPGSVPLLAVLAGQGAGPIRIGANVSQVERLMMHKCEIRTEHLCRYVRYGLDFNLVGGITQSIHAQRRGRYAGRGPDGKDLKFGYFQGMIPPDLRLGMLPEAIQQYLGQPYRVEAIPGPNPQTAVSRHYYPGLTLEYDFVHDTKKHMLGAIFIHKDARVGQVPPGAVDAGAPPGAADAGAPPVAGGPPFGKGVPRDPGAAPLGRDAGMPRLPEPR